MKQNTLVTLVILLGLLGLVAWYNQQQSQRQSAASSGGQVLGDFDPNAVARLHVISGTATVELARVESGWTVVSLWNAPANFDQLSELLRKLGNMKVGEVIRGGTETLEEFGLSSDSNTVPAIPARLVLFGEGGSALGDLVLGQPRMPSSMDNFAMPDSQYVRLGDGPVLLVAPFIEYVPRRAEDWLDRKVLEIQADQVTSVQASLAGGTNYGLSRGESGFTGTGALAGKKLNTTIVEQWSRALQSLNAESVYDPASDRSALGLDQPETVEVQTRNGITAKIQLGKAETDGARPALITLNWQAPALADTLSAEARAAAEKEQQATSEKVVALQKRITPWIYKLALSTASQLTPAQDKLIEAEPPPPTREKTN